MGLFSSIRSGFNEVVDDVKGWVTAPSSSNPATVTAATSRQQAELKVMSEYVAKRVKYYEGLGYGRKGQNSATNAAQKDLQAFIKTTEYEQLVTSVMGSIVSGSNVEGSGVAGFLETALSSVATSAVSGLQEGIKQGISQAVNGGINTIGENLGINPKASTIQETLGNFAIGSLVAGSTNWLKRNWFYMLIPGGFILYFAVKAFRGNKRGTTKTRARRR